MLSWNESSWLSVAAGAALKSTLVLGAAWLLCAILRRRAAATRHLIWTGAAAAVLALPFFTIGLPVLRVPAPGALRQINTGLIFRAFSSEAVAAPVTTVKPATTRGGTAPSQPTAPAPSRPWLLWIWAAGTVASLMQIGAAYYRMGRLRSSSPAFDDQGLGLALAQSLDITHDVPVLEAPEGTMPMAFGFLRPAIFLPADASAWTDDRRRMVLLHELAHVQRGDLATHLVARLALSLHWWNPLAYIAWREFLKERERAADDLVLITGARASDYASHLLEVARSMQSEPATAWAAVAMARPSQLEGRLLAVLDSKQRRAAARRIAPALAAIVAVVAVAPFAAIRAQDTQQIPPDVDATIRAAVSQKNHEILDNAAQAYIQTRKYDVAKTLLETSLQIRGESSGQTGAAYATGLVKIAQLEEKRGHRDEAMVFHTKAVMLGDRPEVAPSLVFLGKRAFSEHRLSDAQNYFERAINVEPTGPQAGPATTWLAIMKQQPVAFRANTLDIQGADAEYLFQRALALEGQNTRYAADTMLYYASMLQRMGRKEEADQLNQKARAIYGEIAKAATAAITPSAGTLRVGNGVLPPALLFKIEPAYTEEARAAKLQGVVLLYIEVGPDGYAHNAQVLEPLGLGLEEKAIEAVQQWKFRPGTKDGQPVSVAASIEINFRLL